MPPASVLHQSLTFSLDLIHTDGVLGVERPDLAGRQRVSPLDAERRRLRRRLHDLDERLRACDRHDAAPLPQNFSGCLCVRGPHKNHFARTLPAETVGLVYL